MNLWQHHLWDGLLRNRIAIIVFIVVLSGISVTLAAGFLDVSFGTGGVAITSLEGNSGGTSVAIQSDGKIVVAGSTMVGSQGQFALARYTISGTLDTGFGAQGVVTTGVSAIGQSGASAVAIQSDGKLVAAGSSSEGIWNSYLALARYTTTGMLDPEFGSGGIVTTPIGVSGGANAIALQPDGKIVVAGAAQLGADMVVARYLITGSLDTDFGSNGIVTLSPGNQNYADSVVVQPDHKIVVAGVSSGQFTVVRLNPSGLLDADFGTSGIAQTSIPGSCYAGASAVARQTDGKLVVAGAAVSKNCTKNEIAVVRYGITGTLDSSFGSGGIVTTTLGAGDDYGRSVAIQPDGRIVVGGRSNDGVRDYFALVRYSSMGSLDARWGAGGVLTSSVGISFSYGNSVALQPDGRIVLAGYSSDDGVKTDFAVARYLADIYTNFVYLPVIQKE